jgi:hypothetical protein
MEREDVTDKGVFDDVSGVLLLRDDESADVIEIL